MRTKTLTAAALALIPLVSAGCQLSNGFKGPAKKETNDAICRNQGKGAWTFSMQTSMMSTGLPTSEDGDPNGELDNNSMATSFNIYDESCNLKATYAPPDCGYPPWTIKENFLKDVLTIQDVSMDVGSPDYTFNYGDGKYSIRNNHCKCNNLKSSFNSAKKACGCAFSVDGIFKDSQPKRSVEFQV